MSFDNSKKYFKLGELLAALLLKGVIHPDMQEGNVGVKNGRCILLDFADVEFFEYPNGINQEVIRRLTDSLFPPITNILKDFELVSSFRAGFISLGGDLAKIIFDNTIKNGLSSSAYTGIKINYENNYSIDAVVLNEWRDLIVDKLRYEETGDAVIACNPEVLAGLCNLNSYYAAQMVLLNKYIELATEDGEMPLWLTALNFACEAIKQGFIYTGYGVFRKTLHMCKHAYPPIVVYHAKIEGLLEGKSLCEDLKKLIEDNMRLNLFQLMWLLNDIDLSKRALE